MGQQNAAHMMLAIIPWSEQLYGCMADGGGCVVAWLRGCGPWLWVWLSPGCGCGCVAVWLCGCVAVWLGGYVAEWLGGWVAMRLCGYCG